MTAFDLQINGYGGVDFNQDELEAEDLYRACCFLAEHEVGGILATIITEDPKRMEARIRRLRELWEIIPLARQIIAGIHIEGPFSVPRMAIVEHIRPTPSKWLTFPWPIV